MKFLALLFAFALSAAPAAEVLQEFRTPTGLRVVLEARHERPLIRLELRVAWRDGEIPPEGSACAGEMLCAVLGRCGAGGVSRVVLERNLADRGLRLGMEGRRRSLAWSMLADSQDQEDAFTFLANAVFRPGLADGIAATLKEAKPSVTPEDAFRAALGFSAEGVTLCDLDPVGLYALHRRLVRPDHAVLLIQGDVSLAQARQLVMLHLGTWAPAPEPLPQEAATPPRVMAKHQRVPGGQNIAWAGTIPPEGNPRERADHVMLALLLEQAFRVRPEAGITLQAPRPEGDAGPLLFRAHLPTAGDPEQSLRACLERLLTRGFNATELESARARWRAERMALPLHPEDQLAARSHGLLFGDPGVYLEEVRLEDVNAALRKRLSPESMQWLVQGPETKP